MTILTRTVGIALLVAIFLGGCDSPVQPPVQVDEGHQTENDQQVDDDQQGSPRQIGTSTVQIGPYISDSIVLVRALDSNLEPMGQVFVTQTSNDLGEFRLGSAIETDIVEVIAIGFYFNGVAGEVSDAPLTLRSVVDLSVSDTANVNLLTTLTRDRIIHLVTEEGLGFNEAKHQAEQQLLAAFNIPWSDEYAGFESMDISNFAKRDGLLLAISAVLQADNSVAELSELISKINNDFRTNGELDEQSTVATIRDQSFDIGYTQLEVLRSNLSQRYNNSGLTVTVPDFEQFVSTEISDVKRPKVRSKPVKIVTETGQYNGHVRWTPEVSDGFVAGIAYTAIIELTAKPGYTLTGPIANSFIVAGATSVTHSEDSGLITVTADFPRTEFKFTDTVATESLDWTSVTYGNGLFVAVASNRVMTSPDGSKWTAYATGKDRVWSSVTYGNGRFVEVGHKFGGSDQLMTSHDGFNWTARTATENGFWTSVTYGNGRFVAVTAFVGGASYVMTSDDGITWKEPEYAPYGDWRSVTYGDGLFVAVGSTVGPNQVMTSFNGKTWEEQSAPDGDWRSVTYGDGRFVAVGYDRVMTSPDGELWTAQSAPEPPRGFWSSVTYGDGLFVAVGEDRSGGVGANQVMTSFDGNTWEEQSAPDGKWRSVTYGDGRFVAVSGIRTFPGQRQVMYGTWAR